MPRKHQPRDGQLVAVRLSAEEIEALEKMVRIGVAANTSEAIRVAIRVAPAGLASQVIADIERLSEQTKALGAKLDELATDPNWWGGLSLENLMLMANNPVHGEAAQKELTRRGYMPKGKQWVPVGMPREGTVTDMRRGIADR